MESISTNDIKIKTLCSLAKGFNFSGRDIPYPSALKCSLISGGYLKKLCEGDEYALLEFLLTALDLSGYPAELPQEGTLNKFDFESGAFTDEGEGAPVSMSTVEMLRFALYHEGAPSSDGYKRALRLLRSYFSYHTEEDLPTVGELLNIL